MTDLHPCRICGHAAIEQARGSIPEPKLIKLKVKDDDGDERTVRFQEWKAENKGWVPGCVPDGIASQHSTNQPAYSKDVRIICGNPEFVPDGSDIKWKCDNSTGWMAADMADYMRFCWNRDNPPGAAVSSVQEPEAALVAPKLPGAGLAAPEALKTAPEGGTSSRPEGSRPDDIAGGF